MVSSGADVQKNHVTIVKLFPFLNHLIGLCGLHAKAVMC